MGDNNATKDYWDASLYDGKHAFVSNFGNDVIKLLDAKKGERILDLGCGTGDLAHSLTEMGVTVGGVDKSKNMIDQAKAKYPNIVFGVSDAIELDYQNEFDAVFSNAVLHWVKPPKQALQSIYQTLKPKGRFVAEFGGKGNVKIITDEILNQFESYEVEFTDKQFLWYFPSIGEYSTLMEEVGFRVMHVQHFDRPTPLDGENGLRNWLEMFSGGMFEGISNELKNEIFNNIETNVRETLYLDGCWFADYKRIRVIGVKES